MPAKKANKPASKNTAKKTFVTKRNSVIPTAEKKISDKERLQRAANLIENSEKKKNKSVGKRVKKATSKQTLSLTDAIIEGMKEKKANNITLMNLSGIENRVTDYFVIADAESKIHANSIAEGVIETVEKLTNDKIYHHEGKQNGEWILLDYINVVAHVFLREERTRYKIEGLWGDADITYIND